jgi:hypothetical protein
MRVAQFRRKLPACCKRLALTGPFETPEDWSPDTFQAKQRPPHITNPVHTEEQVTATPGPKDYLDWIKSIPLAESATLKPLSYMVSGVASSARLFEADTVPP